MKDLVSVITLAVLLSFAVSPIHAASFDCAKAKTFVEKEICADAVLSELDERLHAAYKKAVSTAETKESTKRRQKEWLETVRNACRERACIKAAYEERLSELESIDKNIVTTNKKYPPYPDVWELKIPLSEKTQYFPRTRSIMLENHDVIIGYLTSDKFDHKKSIASISSKDLTWVTFFSRLPAFVNETGDTVRTKDSPIIKPKREVLRKDSYPGTAELKAGRYVVSTKLTSHDCYIGPAKNILDIYQSRDQKPPNFQRKLLSSKVVFLLLDEPILWTGAEYRLCDESDKSIHVKVVSLYGKIIPLEDGGFLLIDENVGWVFRFNSDLSMRTSLLNKRLFIFDLGKEKDPLFINKITGKTYMDKNGKIRMQEALDDLYDYLVSIKKGEE